MENVKVKEFVLRISALWYEQKKRELLYLEALKKDSMGSLRKILAQGHFSALLFQKEIVSIYDYFKCLLNDKELSNLTHVSFDNANLMQDLIEKEQVVGLLKKTKTQFWNLTGR
ncbi:hypothetical protein [Dyadobacter sp. NIV53]|uniref:hypothetical protein n=1 Tax=Dyadobacter sp. NIV53 TaxID=2861765 RepID=UPI001C87ACD5|nr:hypothetical protein [Dyadobacter sp. NIV53]